MSLLMNDVPTDFFNIGLTHSKCAVSTLPREMFHIRKNIVHPAARIRLEIAQDIRQRFVGTKLGQQVDMILGTIKFQRNTTKAADCAANVVVETSLMCFGYQRATVLSREDYVVKEIGIRIRHVDLMRLPPASRAGTLRCCTILGFASLHPRLYANACSAGYYSRFCVVHTLTTSLHKQPLRQSPSSGSASSGFPSPESS